MRIAHPLQKGVSPFPFTAQCTDMGSSVLADASSSLSVHPCSLTLIHTIFALLSSLSPCWQLQLLTPTHFRLRYSLHSSVFSKWDFVAIILPLSFCFSLPPNWQNINFGWTEQSIVSMLASNHLSSAGETDTTRKSWSPTPKWVPTLTYLLTTFLQCPLPLSHFI